MPDNIASTPIVFLDIDGVLQPVNNENRFNYDMTAIQNELAEKFNDDIYTKIDKYDVAAVWIDWEKEAVENLKILLDSTDAKLVLSTSWRRYHVHKELIALFRLHGLESYVVGQTRLLNLNDGSYIGFADYESQEIYRELKWSRDYQWHKLKETFCLDDYGEPDYKIYSEDDLSALETLPYVRSRLKRAREKYTAERIPKNIHLSEREREILLFIQEHDIKNYISLDDGSLYLGLGKRAITVSYKDEFFNKSCLEMALDILRKN